MSTIVIKREYKANFVVDIRVFLVVSSVYKNGLESPVSWQKKKNTVKEKSFSLSIVSIII